MKHTLNSTLFAVTNWFAANPRRLVIALTLTAVVLTLAFAAMPDGIALAEDIVGGS